jgi:hypothetical protein
MTYRRQVHRLAGPEQLTGKVGLRHAGARASGAVKDENELTCRIADYDVVQAQFGHHFPGVEAEVACDKGPFLRLRIVCCKSRDAKK